MLADTSVRLYGCILVPPWRIRGVSSGSTCEPTALGQHELLSVAYRRYHRKVELLGYMEYPTVEAAEIHDFGDPVLLSDRESSAPLMLIERFEQKKVALLEIDDLGAAFVQNRCFS